MYSAEFQDSLKAVEAARAANIAYEPARMTAQEKDDLLQAYHPDYKKNLPNFRSARTRAKRCRMSSAKCCRRTAASGPRTSI